MLWHHWPRAVLVLLVLTTIQEKGMAVIGPVTQTAVAESEEPYAHRLYYYDMDLDASGDPHVIYALPQANRLNTHIIYTYRKNGAWHAQTLSTEGKYTPTGIQLDVGTNDKVHVTYVTGSNDYDSALVYQAISNGTAQSPIQVSSGGWRSFMSLWKGSTPMIMREWESGFHLYTLEEEYSYFSLQNVTLPISTYVRLGEFVADPDGGLHLLFGDHAHTVPADDRGHPASTAHNLWYASAMRSTSATENTAWTAVVLDQTGRLYDWEFWVDLAVTDDGSPVAAMYSYNTAQMSTVSTYGVFFHKTGGTWQSALCTPNQTRAREGMGPGIVTDEWGFHGVWDNSPPEPYEFASDRGGLYYRYSPDGANWQTGALLAPYSAEGRCITRRYGNILHVLVLGDYTDTKLYHLQCTLPGADVFQLEPERMIYYQNDPAITLNLFLRGTWRGDPYLVAIGQYFGGIYYFGGDMAWHQAGSIDACAPIVPDLNATGLNLVMPLSITDGSKPIASVNEIFDCYWTVLESGTPPSSLRVVMPLGHRMIYSKWPLP